MSADHPPNSRARQIALLAEASHALAHSANVGETVSAILGIARRSLGADVVFVAMADERGRYLTVEHVRGRRVRGVRGRRIDFGRGVLGTVARRQKPIVAVRSADLEKHTLSLERKLVNAPRSVLAVPMQWRGEFIGVLEAIHKKGAAFDGIALHIAEVLGGHIAQAYGGARVQEHADRVGLEYSRLAQVSADVGKSLGLDEVLERIIANLDQLVSFDAVAIFVSDPKSKTVTSVLHRGYPRGAGERIQMKSHEGIVGLAARRKEGIIVDDVRKHPRYCKARAKTRSELVVPMVSRQGLIGTFNLESDRVAAFDENDLEILDIFAANAAVAIERARLYEEQRERRAIQRELRLARTVQTFFTPQKSHSVGRYRIAGVNYPSLEVSGDYHDYFPLGGNRLAFAVADVAGKGVPASIIMASFRATLHSAAPELRTALQITLRANRVLLETVRPQDFVTAFIGVIDGSTGEVTYCNAGHNPPILMRPSGEYRTLESGGPVLGVFADPPMVEGRFVLGDEVFLCYTDGATEARAPDGKEYGEERLVAAMRENLSHTPARLARNLFGALKNFTGLASQSDDTTYLVLRRRRR